jgi:restriction system protein
MGRGGRRLRERYRDESTVAALMDVPGWLFIAITVIAAAVALVLGVIIDVLIHKPNYVLTALSPIVIVLFSAGLFWLSVRERVQRRHRLSQISTAEKLWALTPNEMEDIATELFRLQGYVVTENKRPDLADGGVDFEINKEGKTWLVQVKHWRQEVTVKEARELWGIVAGESAAGGVLIGTSGFSTYAREFADGKDLRLIDGPEFMHLRSELSAMHHTESADSDPLVSQDFAHYLSTLPHPACPTCGKPMVLVTRLRDTHIASQFWGCSLYPDCQGTRRFAFPYLPAEEEQPRSDARLR